MTNPDAVRRLDPFAQAWMSAPSTRAVMDALDAAKPGGARFVGGCVRNALMGRPIADVDIATQLTPPAVMAAVEASGLKAVPTGIEHGTITVVARGQAFEVTTLRRDVETDGRRAVVAFTEDWREDAARRDFRLNALYADASGTLYDYVDGLADAELGRIIFIGDAEARIREDYLRILRFFRFHAWYGAGRPDAAGLKACARLRAGLDALSAERMWMELKKLLGAPDPRIALRWMGQTGVIDQTLGAATRLEGLDRLIAAEIEFGWPADALLRLAAASDDIDALAVQMKASGAERKRLNAIQSTLTGFGAFDPKADLAALLYRADREAWIDAARLAIAEAEGAARIAWLDRLAFAQSWRAPSFPVTGSDLKAAGRFEGPALGEALKALEAMWIESGFTLTRAELLNAVQS